MFEIGGSYIAFVYDGTIYVHALTQPNTVLIELDYFSETKICLKGAVFLKYKTPFQQVVHPK